MAQTFSGFNVPQKWDARANYQGGQGGQLVTHALITWRALRPRNGVPPGTISGQWEQVPDTITSPAQAPSPGPTPNPKPVPPAPKPTPPLTATLPLSIVSNNISVAVMTPSGDGARSGIVGAPPDTPGTSLFWREDATWAAAGGGGGGTVTSVALTVPAEFSVAGSPVTTAGTLAVSWNSEAQNLFIASPDGSSGVPSFRAIVAADLPNTAVTPGSYTYASITVDQQGRLTAASSGAAPTGTVTSVAMTVPTELSVGGSPITTSGTLALSWNNEAQNKVFAGPTSGTGVPTFRSIVATDLPNTAVTPGSYTYSSITVDAQGRITAASSGAAPTGTVTSVAMTVPTELSVSGSPITTSGTLALSWNSEAQNKVFAAPSGSSGTPSFRLLVASDIPSLSYVTSVALTVPASILSVSGSPITSSGTLAVSLATQTANFVWAGPTTGSPATPTFRALVTADLPAGTGTVTSVAMTVPTELSVGGSPITTSGTLALSWNSEAQHSVFAGPSGGAGTPTFRALVASDIPALSYVTSIALTAPTEITVGGSPITSSGTIALSWTNESANKVFAGPTSGGATTPTFRSLVTADLPAGTGTVTSVALTAPAEFTVGGSPVTASGTLALTWANESANKVFSGPASGGATTPNFRSLVALDLASGGSSSNFLRGDMTWQTVPTPPPVSASINLFNYQNFF